MKKFILAAIMLGLATAVYADTDTQRKLNELQQQIVETHAQLEQAQATLKKAEEAQAQGKTAIGNFQFINDSSMQQYKQDVVSAQANYQAAINNYNRYAKGMRN